MEIVTKRYTIFTPFGNLYADTLSATTTVVSLLQTAHNASNGFDNWASWAEAVDEESGGTVAHYNVDEV